MATTTNPCLIAGDWLRCPADSNFFFDGNTATLAADIVCPLDSVSQSEWIEASQQGRCMCDSNLVNPGGDTTEMDCECSACPPGSDFGFAFECTTPIFLNCLKFNCFGQCNDDVDLPNGATGSPTAAPTDVGSGVAGSHSSSVVSTAALVLLVAFRMLR